MNFPSFSLNHLIAGVAFLTALPSLGGLFQSTGNMNQLRTEAARLQERSHVLQLTQQEIAAADEIARHRFEHGCIPVVAPDLENYASLVDGQPVVDRTTGVPLPIGTVVCDAHGNTGVMVPDQSGSPVVGAMAYTGDRAVVQARLAQFQGASYSQPTN